MLKNKIRGWNNAELHNDIEDCVIEMFALLIVLLIKESNELNDVVIISAYMRERRASMTNSNREEEFRSRRSQINTRTFVHTTESDSHRDTDSILQETIGTTNIRHLLLYIPTGSIYEKGGTSGMATENYGCAKMFQLKGNEEIRNNLQERIDKWDIWRKNEYRPPEMTTRNHALALGWHHTEVLNGRDLGRMILR